MSRALELVSRAGAVSSPNVFTAGRERPAKRRALAVARPYLYLTTFQEILDEKYTPEAGMKKAQAEIEKVLAPHQK